MTRGGIAIAALIALLLGAAGAAHAEAVRIDKTPVLMTADQLDYDRGSGVVSATGNVEISQGKRVMKADRLSYNQKTGVVKAIGHISITEPGGEVIFMDSVELTREMREGVIENIRVLFPDNTRFAANGAVRTGGNKTDMRKAVFSPCALCPDDPTRAPLWQIKAERIVHDQAAQVVSYENAYLEIGGVPIAWAPVFWHADPTVKRRTGFLPPTFSSDNQLGFTVRPQYFIVLSRDWDATLSPIFPTEERPVAAGQIRHRVKNGAFEVSGSFTRVTKKDLSGDDLDHDINRGHIIGKGRFDIDKTWRWGFDGALTTDDTYLRRYNISSSQRIGAETARSEVLTSRAFIEGFRGRSYASAEAFHFQGLRIEDKQSEIPFIAPMLNYNFISRPLANGSRWSFDANVMTLTRIEGTDSRRISATGGWQMPFVGRLGDLYRISASVQSDLYWVNEVARENRAGTFRGVTGRVFPQATVDWRYPFVRELGNVRQLIEPRVAFTIAPNGHNPGTIPNEDSQNFEFDDTNLFSANRFPGLDRVDGGKRLTYGLRTAFYGDDGGLTEIFIGQSFRFRDDDTFAPGTGIGEDFSDIVGRILIRPSDYLDVNYRFRFDREEAVIRRTEVQVSAGPESLRLNANYLFFDESTDVAEFDVREQISGGATAQLTKYWSISANGTYDLAKDGPLSYGGAVTYQDECLLISANLTRNFTTDRDFKASTEVFVRVVFKHLGEINASK